MDDPRYAHITELFQRGWQAPGPGAWDELLTDDVELVQPMVPTARGRDAWDQQIGDVLELVPDLRGTVQHWSGHGNTLFIELVLEGTLGGKPVSWGLVDVLTLEGDRCRKRVSYFDSAPLAMTILRRPRAWRAAALTLAPGRALPRRLPGRRLSARVLRSQRPGRSGFTAAPRGLRR